jgi:hypothetical protein
MRAMLATPMSSQDKFRLSKLVVRSMLWQRAELTRDVTQTVRRSLGFSDEYTF